MTRGTSDDDRQDGGDRRDDGDAQRDGDGRLHDEAVILTGASRGLGASMATQFVREGANVALTARGESDLRTVAESVADAPGDTIVVPTDVTDEAAVAALVEATVDAFGEVTGLVNNAGIGTLSLHDERRTVLETESADWRRILEVNLTGSFLCVRHAVPELLDAGGGNVINVSSGLGRRAAPGWGPYVASKWGLEGFSRTLSDEIADAGVNVNCLDPGGRVGTRFWDHLPEGERDDVLEPDVMDEAATRLLAQGSGGVTRESHPAAEWERRLDRDGSASNEEANGK
ncbi:SDR family NAD(P)-dependent oxidoreductase [Halopenitus persicus]|uniref:SDR family NAD(P)-dependent oxidoreductase n=1 Tax=Halopenitus persicus TaxID=1048396 RepID=UPI000BBA889E|nr:SDR family oxidoreductase [Halopenitus persicus]